MRRVFALQIQNGIDSARSANMAPRFEIHHNVVMTLAEYLKAHRITQAEFGRKLDPPVSQGKVNHWLQGTRRVSLAEGLQIVEVTGGEVDMPSLAALAGAGRCVPNRRATPVPRAQPAMKTIVAGEGAHA